MTGPITLEALNAYTLVHAAHLDGPRGTNGWFGNLLRCQQQPRLTRLDKCIRKTRTVEVSWHVDGRLQVSLEAAIEALNVPPEVTDEEAKVLGVLGDEFVDMRQTINLPVLMDLRDKGLVEFAEGKCRRRPQP